MDSIIILLHAQKHLLKSGGSHMHGFVLDHFQQLVVIVYDNMPTIQVGVEFLQTKS